MKPTIHTATWYDLIANGHPLQGRFYCQDLDGAGGYLVFELAEQKIPKNLHQLATGPPRSLEQVE